MALVKNGELVTSSFVDASAAEAIPPAGPVIVNLDQWKAHRDELLKRGTPLGIRLHSDQPPELVAAAPVPEVDLEAHLSGPAGPGHHHGDVIQRRLQEPVVTEPGDRLPEERAHDLLRGGALDLQRRHVGLADLDSQPRLRRDGPGPQQHVAVRERQPEMVLSQAEQHRVVDHAAVVRRDRTGPDRRVASIAPVAAWDEPGSPGPARREDPGDVLSPVPPGTGEIPWLPWPRPVIVPIAIESPVRAVLVPGFRPFPP